MDEVLGVASAAARRYLAGVHERSVAPLAEAVDAARAGLGGQMPAGPTDAVEVVGLLDELGSPATVVNAGGRWFGLVNGGALPATVGAAWLAAAWDQNAGMRVVSPVAAALEEIAGGWLLDVLGLGGGLEGGCAVGFVSGCTMANFASLCAARHRLLEREGWDVEAKGLFGAPELRVVVGEEVHASVRKALAMAGLGRERVEVVKADGQGRMVAGELPRLDARTIVCVQAGNVNTGAFDPFAEVVARAREAGAWVHVDGAFGLWAAASSARRELMVGVEGADSWAADGHKWLNVPYDCGLVFCRDREALGAAMAARASYLTHDAAGDPCDFTPELSRRARGVEVWAALRSLGRSGLEEMIERCCGHAVRFAEGLREAGFEILNDVVINQVLVRFGDEARTRRVIEELQREGTCWCGGTVFRGTFAMRISVSSWATTAEDVEMSLKAMLDAAGAG